MAAHWSDDNKWRLNLDNGHPLENRRSRPGFAKPNFFTHASELIPSRVAGSTAAGAAMLRAPKERPLNTDDFQGPETYEAISKDYNNEIHIRVDRPINYRKPFTQNDNIKPISSIPNFKTLQNITYKPWPRQDKERYHWAINGIKHTTQKYCTELTRNTQYDYDYHDKLTNKVAIHKLGGPNSRNRSFCLDGEQDDSEVSTYSTRFRMYNQKNPKRGICHPIDGMMATLHHEDYYGGRKPPPRTAPDSDDDDESNGALRIYSKKDKKARGDCHFANMRNSMHFYTTYKDWYYQNALPTL